MKRALAFLLIAVFAVACRDHGPLTELPAGPLAAISDGAHTGNPDFFFLPPIVPNPSGDANFEPAEFNAALGPTVQVCAWSGTACGTVVAQFTMSSGLGSQTISVNPTDGQYMVNWHTDLSNLNPAVTYRILVWVGSADNTLGFADVDVVNTGKELKNVNTGEFIGLQNGRTLPIKFRIENGALCSTAGSDGCASETIDLAAGGDVIIPQTGDRIDIPPQASGQEVTLTIEYCDGVDVDLPKFGPCLHVTAEPALTEDLFPRAVVSLCSEPLTGLTEEQEDLVTLHRQDGEVIKALPHAHDFCPEVIGSRPTGFGGLLLAGWDAVTAAFSPRPLQASLAVLDAGVGGETEGFSDFQFALPAMMTPLEGTDDQRALPGQAVPIPPGVMLTDWHGDAVAGATVRFEQLVDTDDDGLGDTWETFATVDANEDGVAQVESWVLALLGTNQLRASGRGIADPADERPFMPDITLPVAEQAPVVVGTGEVLFDGESRILFGSSGQGTCCGPSDLYVVEAFATGSDILIGRLRTASGSQPVITDIARSPSGDLWAISFTTLYQVDQTTAILTEVGSLGVSSANALAFDQDGNLFGVTQGGSLFSVNTGTGQTTAIGSMGLGSQGDIAFAPDGTLFGTASGEEGSVLVAINKTTGAATVRGAIGFGNAFGLAFVGSQLYCLTAGTAELLTLDQATGAGTAVRELGFDAFGSAAARVEPDRD